MPKTWTERHLDEIMADIADGDTLMDCRWPQTEPGTLIPSEAVGVTVREGQYENVRFPATWERVHVYDAQVRRWKEAVEIQCDDAIVTEHVDKYEWLAPSYEEMP